MIITLQLTSCYLFQATEELLKKHYADLSSKPFFPGLVKYMSSGPVVPMVSNILFYVNISNCSLLYFYSVTKIYLTLSLLRMPIGVHAVLGQHVVLNWLWRQNTWWLFFLEFMLVTLVIFVEKCCFNIFLLNHHFLFLVLTTTGLLYMYRVVIKSLPLYVFSTIYI